MSTQWKIDSPSLHKFQHSDEIDDYTLLKPVQRKSGHAAFGQYKFNTSEVDDEQDVSPVENTTDSSSMQFDSASSFGKQGLISGSTNQAEEETKKERITEDGLL